MDAIYEALGTSAKEMEEDSHSVYAAQVQRAQYIEWSGEWSVFQHKKDNVPRVVKGDFCQLVRIVGRTLYSTREKDGMAICPSVFKDGETRQKENVDCSWFIGIDYDELDAEMLREWVDGSAFGGCLSLLYNSWQDGTAKESGEIQNRGRIILPLSRSVSPEEFESLMRWVFSSLTYAGYDTSCKDPSRLFFTMRTNVASVRKPWIHVRMGEPLNPDRLPDGKSVEVLIQEEKSRKAEEKRKSDALLASLSSHKEDNMGEDEYLRHYALKSLEAASREVSSTAEGGGKYGGRNNTLNAEAFSMGQLVSSGLLSESEVTMTLLQAAIACGLSEREASATLRSGLRKGVCEPRDVTAIRIGFRERQERKKQAEARRSATQSEQGTKRSPFDEEPKAPLEREDIEIEGDLHQKSHQLLAWLYSRNEHPTMFLRGREVVRVVEIGSADIWSDRRRKEIEVMDAKALRAHFMDRLRFVRMERRTNNATGEVFFVSVAYDPSVAIFEHLLSMDQLRLPPLEEVIRNPVVDRRGAVVRDDGYHRTLKAFVDLGGVNVQVPESPSEREMKAAKALILDDLFGDFPFADESSRVHALQLALLPYVRHLISGPTPLHMISAPVRGTGKSLLISLISIVATGEYPESMTEGKDDEEWRKRITATLLNSPSFVIMDNINNKLDSGSLASVLTTTMWVDRLMGHSKVARLPNSAIWCATANNPSLSDEIERRCLYIHLDPATDTPEGRRGFKHNPIQVWCMENREQLLTACLTLIRYWAVRGMKRNFDKHLASFENWSALMGGILAELGEDSAMLQNRGMYRGRSDSTTLEWRAFCEIWWETFEDRVVSVKELQQLASNNEVMEEVLGSKNEQSQRIRLAKALQMNIDRMYGPFRIKRSSSGERITSWTLSRNA